jgi:adenylate cyclase
MPMHRRLVAVVAADVAGYSRLMERDEAGTHQRLRTLREALLDPKIAEHGGRTVKTAGDGMLLEFPSATSALRCAVEVQRELGVRNLYIAADEKLELRIGINLGDIIVDGEDIAGDGVNVAARLETLAEPGGICVASAVYEQVHDDLGIEFIDIGAQQVKNITRPIPAFRVALGKASASPVGRPARNALMMDRNNRLRWAIAAGAVAMVAAVGAVLWQSTPRSKPPATANTTVAPAHSVIILPFVATTDDPALPPIAARLTVDFTPALREIMRDMHVTAPNVAAAYSGKTADVRTIGRDANVRYLIEGDVSPAGAEAAVTVRLVDTRDALLVQTERRVIELARFPQGSERFVRQLAVGSRIMLYRAIVRSAQADGSPPVTARDFVDRANAVTVNDTALHAREVRKLVDEAIRLDPALAVAWAIRANSSVDLFESDFTIERERVLKEADADSLRAVTLDPHDGFAWAVRGIVLAYLGHMDAAFAASDRALELDSGTSWNVLMRGWLYVLSGRPSVALETVELLRAARGRLDGQTEALACEVHLLQGAYADAIAACERAAAADDDWIIFSQLTAAYAMSGDVTRATQARVKLLQRRPDFTIAGYEAKRFSMNPEYLKLDRMHVIAGLRKAGVPE